MNNNLTSKIYTKTGDDGKTSILGGKRVEKCCLELKAIGEIDELNAYIGVVISLLTEKKWLGLKNFLTNIQNNLFIIGSNIAAVQINLPSTPKFTKNKIKNLEKKIDEVSGLLPPLHNFILPGGSRASSQAFLARAVCRRAERQIIKLEQNYPNNPNIRRYINRLSDFLFVLARFLNQYQSQGDKKWQRP